jgi:replicative DNA helicase
MRIQEIIPKVLNLIEEAHEALSASMIRTGYDELDRMMEGLYPGELGVIAGTKELSQSFAQNVILNQLKAKPDASILIICPRMSKEQYAMLLMSVISEIPFSSVSQANPPLDMIDWERIRQANEILIKSKLQIFEDRVIPVGECFSEFQRQYSASNLDLILIDDLESITFKTEVEPHPIDQSDQNYTLEREETITIIVSYLNEVARKFHVPVLTTFDGSLDKFDLDSHDNVIDTYFNWADLVLDLDDERLGETGLVDIDIRKCKHGTTSKISLFYCDDLGCFNSMDLVDQ